MMKRYLLSIILGAFTMVNYSFGQLGINFSSPSANVGGTVDVDLTAEGFENISVLQFSAGWDSLVMTFNSVVFTNPALPDLSEDNISGPAGAANVDEGQFSFSYGNPTGDGNLDDGEILFTVRFNVVGAECDETLIQMTGDPTSIEAFDANFEELTVTSEPGTVTINGTDCGGGGDELTITASTLSSPNGVNICIPLTVLNFIGVQAGSGTILWDPTVLSYTGLANIALGGLGGSLNETNTDNGELKFVWSNPDPGNPLTIPDGNAIFEICFDVIGDPGDMSPITLSTQGSLGFEWFDDNDDVIPQILNNGKVTVIEVMGDPFIINGSDITAEEGDTNVCVDFTVENFDNIISTQYVLTWDPTILTNATPSNFMLAGLNASSFNITTGCATLSWSGNVGIDLPDGSKIYSMCFDVIGDCLEVSPVDMVSKGNTNIEIVDGNTDVIDNVALNGGSVTVICPVDCEIVSIDRPCAGTLGGNVIVTVPSDNCTYSWTNSSGTVVATSANLLGVGAGTYLLTVTCDGAVVCSLPAIVESLPALVITGDVTDVGCGDLGAISVMVTGGSGNYSYNWNPAQSNSASISDLNPGMYSLTVTDTGSNCTKTAQFQVMNEVANLVISASNIKDETCLGNDGSITLTVVGGCKPYTYAWSNASIGNTPNATNLAGGMYAVTITDNSDPTKTVMGTFTVDSPNPIVLNGSAVIVHSTGNDGSISIVVMGGTPPYSYTWTGPTSNLPNSNMITGLAPGNYTVLVTGTVGCTANLGPFIVNEISSGEPEIADGTGAVNNVDGFSVSCNGDANGIIRGEITGGDLPMTLVLSGSASRTITINDAGIFNISDLTPGTYSIELSNENGSVSVNDIEVSQPSAIDISIDRGCDSEGQCDGFIDLDVAGGVEDYIYTWNVASLTSGSEDGLCKGSYTVVVSDAYGCEKMETIVIQSCEGPDLPCYEVRDVITPNGDGINDQFAVTCINDFPASLEIYDRWGKLVYNQAIYDGTWMGISNSNEALNEGGYLYIINIDFGQGRREIMRGTITLLKD